MSNALYDPLFHATKEVFRLMLELDGVSESELTGKNTRDAAENVAVEIGLVGDMQGRIIYRFSKQTALRAVEILSGMDIAEIDDFVTSAICEIANIISGKTVSFLSEQKIVCDILPPRILSGEETDSPADAALESGFELNTAIGSVELDMLLKTPRLL